MKNVNKNKNEVNYKKISRDIAISQGAYDGRFREKVVADKEKKASKDACRKKIDY